MAESNISSSQETCSPPLSQETCKLLMQMTNTSLVNDVTNAFNSSQEYPTMVNEINSQTETNNAEQLLRSLGGFDMIQIPNHLLAVSCNQPQPIRLPSALPASEIYPGDYSFEISFTCHENAKWVFSEDMNKLYVAKDVCVPINFSTNSCMTDDVTIRAMALFSSPDHASEAVKRCLNHSRDELTAKIPEADHLVRCESDGAHYDVDYIGRNSVFVPFENPAVGQQFSSYIYKFSCWGSCAGGPNRRPLMVVFTLEKSGKVVGRQKIDVKICACPMRDFKQENKSLEYKTVAKQFKRSTPVDDSGTTTEAFHKEPSKKKKVMPETQKKKYTIEVYDRKCYEFLKEMRRSYMLSTILKEHKLFILSTSSDDDDIKKNKS